LLPSKTSSNGKIELGRVFDRSVDLDGVPDGYRAMADRHSRGSRLKPALRKVATPARRRRRLRRRVAESGHLEALELEIALHETAEARVRHEVVSSSGESGSR